MCDTSPGPYPNLRMESPGHRRTNSGTIPRRPSYHGLLADEVAQVLIRRFPAPMVLVEAPMKGNLGFVARVRLQPLHHPMTVIVIGLELGDDRRHALVVHGLVPVGVEL